MTTIVQSQVRFCLVDRGASPEWEDAIPDVGWARLQGGSSCRNERDEADTVQKVSFQPEGLVKGFLSCKPLTRISSPVRL